MPKWSAFPLHIPNSVTQTQSNRGGSERNGDRRWKQNFARLLHRRNTILITTSFRNVTNDQKDIQQRHYDGDDTPGDDSDSPCNNGNHSTTEYSGRGSQGGAVVRILMYPLRVKQIFNWDPHTASWPITQMTSFPGTYPRPIITTSSTRASGVDTLMTVLPTPKLLLIV